MDLIDPKTLAAEAISAKGAALTAVYNSSAYPHDWTEGTGTLGSGGEIDIPAPISPAQRRWLLIQNQSAAAITVKYEGRKADGVTQSFIAVVLAPGASAGTQGASDERGFSAFVPQGIVKITGAANAQISIAEIVE
jgi:hypothetical protein